MMVSLLTMCPDHPMVLGAHRGWLPPPGSLPELIGGCRPTDPLGSRCAPCLHELVYFLNSHWRGKNNWELLKKRKKNKVPNKFCASEKKKRCFTKIMENRSVVWPFRGLLDDQWYPFLTFSRSFAFEKGKSCILKWISSLATPFSCDEKLQG